MPSFILIAFCFLGITLASAATFSGVVRDVPSGERLVIREKKGTLHVVRLNAVMGPVITQPYCVASHQKFRQLALKKRVWVDWFEKKNGVETGKVFLGGEDLAIKLLRRGIVWYDLRKAGDLSVADRGLYKEAQEEAARKHLGVWRDAHAVEPWLWRQARQQASEMTRPGKK